MVYFIKNHLKEINDISNHSYLLLLSIVVTVILCCLLPALLQLSFILLVALSK